MKVVKELVPNRCAAIRCKSSPEYGVVGLCWDLESEVELCGRHFDEARGEFKLDEVEGSWRVLDDGKVAVLPGSPPRAEENAIADEAKAEASNALWIRDRLAEFSIATRDDLEFAASALSEVKGKWNRLDELEKQMTKPMNAALKAARDLFRPAKSHYAEAEAVLKRAIGAFKLKEAAENERAISEAADAHAAGDPAAVADALARVGKVANVEGVSTYQKWDFEIVDESVIPREFLAPNETLIKEHAAHSRKEPTPIPGVRFFPRVVVSSRAS